MENPDTGRVIVGVGQSAGSHQALRYAVAEAKRRQVPLVAVRAFRASPHAWGMAADEPVWPVFDGEVQGTVAQVERAFAETFGGMPADVPITVVVREGGPAAVLVSLANADDLLIVGGCGARRSLRFRTAPVARFCARHATCPTVIVPPAPLGRSGSPRHLAREVALAADALLRGEQPAGRP